MQTLNSVTVVNSDTGNQTASASVGVGQVAGATTVSTGLTNNLFIDSFFLPFLIALIGIWLYRSGLFGMVAWYDSKKMSHKDYMAKKQLQKQQGKKLLIVSL